MANYQDILLDKDGDLFIDEAIGDLVIGDSMEQEVKAILEAIPGNYKNAPLIGADLPELVNSNGTQNGLKAKIRKALAADRKNVTAITIKDNIIDVKAEQK